MKGIKDHINGVQSSRDTWEVFASVMAASVVANILHDPMIFKDWCHYGEGKRAKCPLIHHFSSQIYFHGLFILIENKVIGLYERRQKLGKINTENIISRSSCFHMPTGKRICSLSQTSQKDDVGVSSDRRIAEPRDTSWTTPYTSHSVGSKCISVYVYTFLRRYTYHCGVLL